MHSGRKKTPITHSKSEGDQEEFFGAELTQIVRQLHCLTSSTLSLTRDSPGRSFTLLHISPFKLYKVVPPTHYLFIFYYLCIKHMDSVKMRSLADSKHLCAFCSRMPLSESPCLVSWSLACCLVWKFIFYVLCTSSACDPDLTLVLPYRPFYYLVLHRCMTWKCFFVLTKICGIWIVSLNKVLHMNPHFFPESPASHKLQFTCKSLKTCTVGHNTL